MLYRFKQGTSASMLLRILMAGPSRQHEVQDRNPGTMSKMQLHSGESAML